MKRVIIFIVLKLAEVSAVAIALHLLLWVGHCVGVWADLPRYSPDIWSMYSVGGLFFVVLVLGCLFAGVCALTAWIGANWGFAGKINSALYGNRRRKK